MYVLKKKKKCEQFLYTSRKVCIIYLNIFIPLLSCECFSLLRRDLNKYILIMRSRYLSTSQNKRKRKLATKIILLKGETKLITIHD